MWSNSKKIDRLVFVLLFLVGLGFMLQGTNLLLGTFLVIILSDRAVIELRGGSISFWILCMLAISYYCITMFYGSGMLIAIGCPIAFYIGNKIQDTSEKAVSNIVLLCAFSMAGHIILNFLYELYYYGAGTFTSARHYDVWSGTFSTATGVMVNGTLLAGLLYYFLYIETRKIIKLCGLFCLSVIVIYDLALGGRTFLFLLGIAFFVGIFLQLVLSKSVKNTLAIIGKLTLGVIVLMTVLLLLYQFNKDWFNTFFEESYFYHRFFYKSTYQQGLLETSRMERRLKFITYMFDYPFGGSHARSLVGGANHELWLDVYDKAGVIPYVFLVVYTFISIHRVLQLFKENSIHPGFRVMIGSLFAIMLAQFFVEPIMDGSPILLFFYCLIDGMLAKILFYRKYA